MHVKKNILPFVISLCWKTGMWLSPGTVSHPASSHTPSADRLYRSKRHWQPWCLGTKSCWVIKCVGCLKQFLCEKEPLVTEHIYPIKIGWVTRQESPPSTKESQLDSWLEREILAGEPEKLTGSHSENKNTAHISGHLWKNGKGTCPDTWRCCVVVAAPGTLGVKGVFGGLSTKAPWMSRLEPPRGWGGTRKGHWLLVKMIMLSSYFPRWECHQVFWEKWEEIFSTWRSVRNKILNSTGKILLHRTLIQTKRKASSFKSGHSKDDKERSL